MGIRDRLKNGETLYGTFIKLNSPAVVEIIGRSGFDFAVIDGEHAAFSYPDIENMVRAGDAVSLEMVVRILAPREEHILHALDAGAAGVQIPGLTTIPEMEEAARSARYYPEGNRGLSFNHRATRYGLMDKNSYLKQANEQTLVAVHIESRETSTQIERICDIPFIDVIFIGPVDLSQSLGKPGETGDKAVQAIIENIIKTCNVKNKTAGIFVNTAEEIARYRKMGARYFVCSTDISMFVKGIKETVRLFREN